VSERLHIIASCTDRKRWAAPRELQLRHTPGPKAATRADRWWDKLRGSSTRVCPAVDLYAGGHWTVVQQMLPIARAAGLRADLWVVSAGYGLIPSSTTLHPYSATFTPGLPDSVCPPSVLAADRSLYLRQWWQSLSYRRGPQPSAARRVRDLVEDSRDSFVLVIASGNYVAAIEDDLVLARKALRDSDHLIVISGESPSFPRSVLPNRVTVDARLQPRMGGALATLGARIAREILQGVGKLEMSAMQLQQRYRALSMRQKTAPFRAGSRMSDEDVRTYLDRRLAQRPESRHTPLLRALRDSGRSCEANRFRRLFLERRST
jgi:hypothetical protein